MLLIGVTASGCSSHASRLRNFNEAYYFGQVQTAEDFAAKHAKLEDTNGRLLWKLQLASVQRDLKKYESSNHVFDLSESALKTYDLQKLDRKFGKESTQVFLNDAEVPFEGNEYDRIMINTYKAMNFLAMSEFADARIEFNRALDRQTDALRRFEDEIQEQEEAIGSAKPHVQETLNQGELEEIIRARYKNLDAYSLYPNYVNPFTTYLAGLFFLLDQDPSKATNILKEAYGMNQDSPLILRDFYDADQGIMPENQLWVIVENGLSPDTVEERIDIPIFTPELQLFYAGIALPKLIERPLAYRNIEIVADDEFYPTEVVCNMDAVVWQEFDHHFKGELQREITRAILKSGSQAALFGITQHNANGDSAEIFSIIAQFIAAALAEETTKADVRYWSTLPKQFESVRMNIPEDRVVTLFGDDLALASVEIPECQNAILFVKIPSPEASPILHLVPFQETIWSTYR